MSLLRPSRCGLPHSYEGSHPIWETSLCGGFYNRYWLKGNYKMLPNRLCDTLIELVGLPSTPGHEEQVRAHLEQRLAALGLTTHIDTAGNPMTIPPGEGEAPLLNAHMDHVAPGRGHPPVRPERLR